MAKEKPVNCLSCRNVVYIDGLDRYECGLRNRTQWHPEKESCGRFQRRRCNVNMKSMSLSDYCRREVESKKHTCGECDHLIWDKEEDGWKCCVLFMTLNEDKRACARFKEKKCIAEKRRKEEEAAFLEDVVYDKIHKASVNIEGVARTVEDGRLRKELEKSLDILNKLKRRIKKMVGI